MIDVPGAGWSAAFARPGLQTIKPSLLLDEITPEWAWGESDGRGVKVAVIDSGIDAAHPAIGGRVGGYVTVTDGPDGIAYDSAPHQDDHGHGTACAGIIRSLAPACDLYSVKVLGQ